MQPIFIIGYRCTGKTSTGKILAGLLDRPFLDTDQLLQSTCSTTITEMVVEHGWDYFRAKETEILMNLNLENMPVVATGGGIVLAPENRQFLKKAGIIVLLYASAEVLTDRMSKDATSALQRPDLTNYDPALETEKMLQTRTPLYKSLAQISVDTEKYTQDKAADLILAAVNTVSNSTSFP